MIRGGLSQNPMVYKVVSPLNYHNNWLATEYGPPPHTGTCRWFSHANNMGKGFNISLGCNISLGWFLFFFKMKQL